MNAAEPLVLDLNGAAVSVSVEGNTPLLWTLRHTLSLSGTRYGCGMALCGACTVHVDGVPTRSCVTPVSAVIGKRLTTIEGLQGDVARVVQDAWVAHDVAQCGYCQSGQIMAATALLNATAAPTDADIDTAMQGHICRCGTYPRIRAAIHTAAAQLSGERSTP